jgi:hypothetical protein
MSAACCAACNGCVSAQQIHRRSNNKTNIVDVVVLRVTQQQAKKLRNINSKTTWIEYHLISFSEKRPADTHFHP